VEHFAGLDVSVKETSVCVVDHSGKIVREVKVVSEPDALLAELTGSFVVELAFKVDYRLVIGRRPRDDGRVIVAIRSGPFMIAHDYALEQAINARLVRGAVTLYSMQNPPAFCYGQRWSALMWSIAWRVCSVSSKRTGCPVFLWRTVARSMA
jgi:hypothetical protein